MDNCFVCGGTMNDYFVQHHRNPESGFSFDRQFIKCERCGLVIDKTSYDMSPQERADINDKTVIQDYQHIQQSEAHLRRDNRIHRQALFMYQVLRTGLIPDDGRIVDYGCATGELAKYVSLLKESNHEKIPNILLYDRFYHVCGGGYITDEEVTPNSFDAVISCAVFEHLHGKEDIDPILNLLNEHGILFLHTLVCEEVPKDPDWYYLMTGHITMWTNAAMTHLYDSRGYVGCAYNVDARMWMFSKDKAQYLNFQSKKDSVEGTTIFSEHFIDYWKQKPYR